MSDWMKESAPGIKTSRRPRRDLEHQEQAALFRWAEIAVARYPALRLMHAIPNGGHRHKATAAKLKREGVKAGVPDICLPVARGAFHGLYIELKALNGRATKSQNDWLSSLKAEGYQALLCKGWQHARAEVERYLEDSI